MNKNTKLILYTLTFIIVVGMIVLMFQGLNATQNSSGCSSSFSDGAAVDKAVQQAAANGADYQQVSVEQRDYRSNVSSAKTVTVMVYMCGADLESQSGAGTSDLNEMLHATLGDDINVIVETGGASQWQNSVISPDTDSIWKLDDSGIQHLKDVGNKDMTDPSTLAEFLNFCKTDYAADRNILVLWDHGGGSVGGYGYDENHPYSPAMPIDDIGTTLKNSGITFDFVGFDACLMASIEDALVLEPSADFLIGSELPEPGAGWYYTDWLTALSKNPSISTQDLGKQIVDDFASAQDGSGYAEAKTLSLIDLTKLPAVFSALDTFSTDAADDLAGGDFSTLSKAREECTGRGNASDYGMVDIVALATKLRDGNAGSNALITSIGNAVAYSRSRNAGNDMYGMTISFPYSDLSDYPELTSLYSSIGFSKSYAGFLSGFESVRSGGQSSSGAGAGTDLSSLPWFQNWLTDQYSSNGQYDTDSSLGSQLPLTEKDGGYVLQLSDKQWSQIADIQLTVLYGRDNVYLDLGADESYSFDDDGDLKIDFDGTWVTLDDNLVEFYADSNVQNDDGTWVSTGYVPAQVNGKDAQIVVQWDDKNPNGFVTGYRPAYSTGVTAKGATAFKAGDTIEYTYDYYDEDGAYTGTYTDKTPVTYTAGKLQVNYQPVQGGQAVVSYQLTDIYGNQYLTEPVLY